jgi:hypothetical protein
MVLVFDDIVLQLIQVNVDALVMIWEELPKTWKTVGRNCENEGAGPPCWIL